MRGHDPTAALNGVASMSASGATLILALGGELDMAASGTLRCLVDGAAASGARQVQFDLTDVAFCDACGLQLLAQAAADIAATGVGVAVARPSDAVTRLADIGTGRVAAAIMR